MAYVVHGIEATNAAVVILVWHMYNALVADGVRGNRAWGNGRVSAEFMKHHHALEWEQLSGREGAPSEADKAK